MNMHVRKLAPCYIVVALLSTVALTNCSSDPALKEARHIKRGKELMEKRDFGHAVLEFTNAAKLAPKDADAHYLLGLALLEAKRAPQAVRSLRTATQLNPKHTEAQVKLAELMVQSRHDAVLQDAEKRMEDLLVDSPDNPDALRALAIAEIKLGKGEEAEDKLTRALERVPGHLKSAASLAALRLAHRDFAGAEAAMKSVIAAAPESTEAGLALAQFYLMSRRLAEAEGEVARVLRIDAGNGSALLLQAAFEVERGQLEQADRTYRRVAALPNTQYAHAYAAFLLQQRRFEEAITEYRALSAAAPSNREARTRLIQAQLAAGKVEDAERELDAALKKNSKDQDALLQRSRIMLAGGRYDDAEKDLRAVIALSPNSADAHFGLARLYGAAGSDLRAREELGEALRLRPDLLSVRAALSRSLLMAGAAQSALEILDAAPDFQKSAAELVISRNWVLLALGRAVEARSAIQAGLARRPNPELTFQNAVVNYGEKKYAAAVADAEAVLARNPLHLRALELAVQARLALKQRAQAEQGLREAARRQPNSAELQAMVGDLLLGLGVRQDGRRQLEAAILLNPSYTPAVLSLARLDMLEDRLDAARERLNGLLKAKRPHPMALMLLGDTEYAKGNRAQAADLYRRASEADRRNVVALNNYAYLRAETDPDGALAFAQKALEMAPESALVLDTLGWIYYRKGLNELAVTNLQKAMSREPTARRQFHLGMAQMKLGQKEAAAQNLSAALKKDSRLTTSEAAW
jgi:tetratricopeptide (TPR) repeat protein